MKQKEIAELLDEPACEHNTKSKSGCARPKPGAAAGGCCFDGAQIALLPIADVAHIVHGSKAPGWVCNPARKVRANLATTFGMNDADGVANPVLREGDEIIAALDLLFTGI